MRPGIDQAAGLRQLFGPEDQPVLPLASVLGEAEHRALLARLRGELALRVRELEDAADWLASRHDEVALALAGDTQSVTAAYTLIKAAVRHHGHRRFRLLFAGGTQGFEPWPVAARMARVARRFLGAEVTLGSLNEFRISA